MHVLDSSGLRAVHPYEEGRSSGVVDDQLNVPLEDVELLAEVEMTTNLIIAATESEHALTQDEVDELLGLTPGLPAQRVREA